MACHMERNIARGNKQYGNISHTQISNTWTKLKQVKNQTKLLQFHNPKKSRIMESAVLPIP